MRNKKVLLTLLVVCLTTLCFTLSACHYQHVNPGTIDNLVGTYKLVTHTYTPDDASGQAGEQQDLLTNNHEEAYLVINKNGYGYYAYKDDSTSYYDTVKLSYTYDAQDSSLISSVEYTRGLDVKSGADQPGCGEENLGFDAENKVLSYNISNMKVTVFGKEQGNKFSSYVKYEKVSDDTTGSYMASKMGVDLSKLPKYEYKGVDGKILKFTTTYQEDNKFIYRYLVIHSNTQTYDTFSCTLPEYNELSPDAYEQKSETGFTYLVEETSNKITFTFDDLNGLDENQYAITINGTVPTSTISYEFVDTNNGNICHMYSFTPVGGDTPINTLILQDITAYEQQHLQN